MRKAHQREIVLYDPKTRKCIDNNDEFVDEDDNPRIFDTILAADSHSAWFESVYGVQLYAKLRSYNG